MRSYLISNVVRLLHSVEICVNAKQISDRHECPQPLTHVPADTSTINDSGMALRDQGRNKSSLDVNSHGDILTRVLL